MPQLDKNSRAILDMFANLRADIVSSPSAEDAERLTTLLAAAARTQLAVDSTINNSLFSSAIIEGINRSVSEEELGDLVSLLDAMDADDNEEIGDIVVIRRDARDRLLSNGFLTALSGVVPNERLGPFVGRGGLEIWFDIYLPAQRIEVREQGNPAPAIVFTDARRKLIHTADSKVDIEVGTVWLRGDFFDAGLPTNAYVGIKVVDGSLQLNQSNTINGDIIEIPSALNGRLELKLAPEEIEPAHEGCSSSQARVRPPEKLTIDFNAGVLTVNGTEGAGEVWGQDFHFNNSKGTWQFIERLWTIILAYEVDPNEFDSQAIGDDLVQFDGVGKIIAAGLSLPVIIAPNISILGEAASSAGWMVQLDELMARWYEPDERFHILTSVWLGITVYGAVILAEDIQALTPAVSHIYELWGIRDGDGHRLPWQQRYGSPFFLLYRCHIIEGEQFMVFGDTDVNLDRPVMTTGKAVPTPSRLGVELLQQYDGEIKTTLGALVDSSKRVHQFALRNALVWTSAPVIVYVTGVASGSLSDPQLIDSGQAQLLFGVHGWAPILPDPYVSNAFINFRREFTTQAHGLLLCKIEWETPDETTVSFEGLLGNNVHIGGRTPSKPGSRPLRIRPDNPDVGLTQTEQGRLYASADFEMVSHLAVFEGNEEALEPDETLDERRQRAQEVNRESLEFVNRYVDEVVGQSPQLLLLDVSTNQDLLGVSVGPQRGSNINLASVNVGFPVDNLDVYSRLDAMRVVALPQVQWEPVRTLDIDQDIMTLGWFPTPLASANDGGATHIGTRSQTLRPIVPSDALEGTYRAFEDGQMVGVRTTFPFGLITAIGLQPQAASNRAPDLYELTRPEFPDEDVTGGIQITAIAEGGRDAKGGVSPMFAGRMRQLLNGVDLLSGTALGISVLGSTGDSGGSVETIFNNDMAANPGVPVTRVDLSGYGGTSFSEWNDPFAAFAEAAKVQFRYMIGRTALEVIKVNSVLHPWGIRVTRSVTIERRPGGGIIRRDSGWQAFTPGLFDYRYTDQQRDPNTGAVTSEAFAVADYEFDAGIFEGLFNVRKIRPAPGTEFKRGGDTLVPYYFDADVQLENVNERVASHGILGFLQTEPNGTPANKSTLQALIEAQGPIGGPLNTWMKVGGGNLPFQVQRVEVGLAMDGTNPIFVAAVRGAPALPSTGAWSVVTRPVANIPPDGAAAFPVAEKRGVPIIRRYKVSYPTNTDTFTKPPLSGSTGDYRFAEPADLLKPNNPDDEYALIQTTPTHAFLFPRPYMKAGGSSQLRTTVKPALADILARSTSKSAFPPPENTIELPAGSRHLNVSSSGKLALSAPIVIRAHPKPLQLAGSTGHGTAVNYDNSTLEFILEDDYWQADFTGIEVWSDIIGLKRITGAEMKIVGSSNQRSQIAELRSLILQEIEDIMQYIPFFGQRGIQGPIDLGASNGKHEIKVEAEQSWKVPKKDPLFEANSPVAVSFKLYTKQNTGFDVTSGGAKAEGTLGAKLDAIIPLVSVGAADVFLIVTADVKFSVVSVSGTVTEEKLELLAFAGVGVRGMIGPFNAYAYLGIGFVLVYDIKDDKTKYGGLVALEAAVDVKVVKVKVRAELKGLVYKAGSDTKCDYSGSVKVQVDIFLIISISSSYKYSDTTTL